MSITRSLQSVDQKTITLENQLSDVLPLTHPAMVRQSLRKELGKAKEKFGKSLTPHDPIYRALTLAEFNNGILLNAAFPEHLHTFSIDLSTRIQEEYGCAKAAEKATAHLAAQSYCRILEAHRLMNRYFRLETISDTGVGYLNFLSKELDRAERHYFNAIQTLQMMRQPTPSITVKTNQANFGQSIVAQQVEKYEAK
jgi:hypothetical protein